MALSLVPRSDARTTASRPSARDGLRNLAVAWRATQEQTVRPFPRPAPSVEAPPSGADDEPCYWPDGPSAA